MIESQQLRHYVFRRDRSGINFMIKNEFFGLYYYTFQYFVLEYAGNYLVGTDIYKKKFSYFQTLSFALHSESFYDTNMKISVQ